MDFLIQGTNGKRDIRWRDRLPGFGVRIYSNGKKLFVLSARCHLSHIIEGHDPLEERKQSPHSKAVRELAAACLERHAKVHKKSWKDDARRIDKYILPAWANTRASNIKRADVAALHAKIGRKHPYEANRVVELLSKMFTLARRWGFVEEDAINPARNIDKFKEHRRDRWVTPEELPRLIQAISQESDVYARAALWLYLLTGVRKAELLRARWDDIDWARKELKLPDTKAGRVHYVLLSGPALTILRNLPRMEDNPHILAGRRDRHHLVNIDKPWRRVRQSARLPDVRLHDLRRTVGSWLEQAGHSLHLIGKVLNHADASTTAIYARFGQDHVKKALESHGRQIMSVANKARRAT
jgi:integrase